MKFPIARKKGGFTFIDVLVGTSLMLVVFFGIFGIYQLGLKIISQSKARITATALSNQKIELARNLPYKDVGTVGGIPSGIIPETEVITQNNMAFTVKTTVVYIDDPFDGLTPVDTLPVDYKRIKVKTSWSGRFQGQIDLVSDVAPKGIETEVGGGTLSISVFDAQGQGISQADLHLVNNIVVPNINAWYQTDVLGKIILPGAPISVEGYQITASKAGHSTDRTYSIQEVANPIKSQASVYERQLTEISFSIDKVSSIQVNTISPVGVSSFADSFLDETKIAEKFHVTVVSGQVQLEASHFSNIILPISGRLKVEFVSEDAGQTNSFGLFAPQEVGIFPYADSDHLVLGQSYDLGVFEEGTEIGFFLATDPNYQGQRWYTDSLMNSDGFDHVRITQPGPSSWKLEWEDAVGGGDKDYNDLVILMTETPEGYFSSGSVISTTITPISLTDWERFYFTDEEPADTQIAYQVLYFNGTAWSLIPEEDLAGNSGGFNVSPVDLSGLSIEDYSEIRLKGNFSASDPINTPVLYDWQVSWRTSSPVPVPNTPFQLEGTKTIGTDTEGKPVLKYSQRQISNSSGQIGINNLEWDSYSFYIDKSETGLNLIETQPVQPVDLLPDTFQSVTLVLKAENTLLITVKDSSTLNPIFAASARVYSVSLGYDVQKPTDEFGQVFFVPLEESYYNLEIVSSGYQVYSGTIFVSGDTASTVNLIQTP